jgi:hypothetical protein
LPPEHYIVSPQPPFHLDGYEFETKKRLAEYLTARTGQPLRYSDGDIPKLVELLCSLPRPQPVPAPSLLEEHAVPVEGTPDVWQAIDKLERKLATQAAIIAHLRQQRRDSGEMVPALQRRVVAIERHVGIVEKPQTPRLTRQRPLEA